MHPENGYSTLTAIMVLGIIAVIGAAVAGNIGPANRNILEMRKQMEINAKLLDALDEVIDGMLQDPTPNIDSDSDPVWSLVDTGTSQNLDVELIDLSSALNINVISVNYLRDPALSFHWDTVTAVNIIQQQLLTKGPYRNLEEAKNIIPDEDARRFFTVYGYWNPYISDTGSLSAIIKSRGGGDVAEGIALSLLGASRSDQGLNNATLAGLLGKDSHNLYALITTRPLINVHHADPELLRSIFNLKFAGRELPDKSASISTVLGRVLSGEVSNNELSRIINREEGQDDILKFLGSETWFWRVNILSDEYKMEAVLVKSHQKNDDEVRYQVVARDIRKQTE